MNMHTTNKDVFYQEQSNMNFTMDLDMLDPKDPIDSIDTG